MFNTNIGRTAFSALGALIFTGTVVVAAVGPAWAVKAPQQAEQIVSTQVRA
jgi:hypothetical protein